ncbi:KGK domain-containing protein [Leptolyngbya sp. FACHB-541]|uniref:KGK domain-containing protein n=1 Tax=Leptolyngbya sp. FACHB-541 TaxID=2692810 RepID=UPI00168890D1|nr:KGK domain-containing protein [Leptolyngbya sp. FACHB-541]MBD1995879.1 KGK domain-containing protein [Leptolyngbya sp. FACHB-541]
MQETQHQDNFDLLNRDEVLSVESAKLLQYLDLPPTLRVTEFVKAIAQRLLSHEEGHLFSQGMSCEVLKFGERNWQKGKIRVSIGFCLDVPESPLDDIRQTIL